MTLREFCSGGKAEQTKGAVHVVLMGIAGICLAYNASAFVFRRQRHLFWNTCLYGSLTVIEGYQVARHWRES